MYASLNTNIMAANTAKNLNQHYAKLATSTQRLSSGLRVHSAADDAAGLAIRELMRADVTALNQGVRNVNDAISMLQVADGALSIIDEKLIRMKELAEQAATGTYDSTQRLMIDSEFQAMGSEIDRIANATDFNGIHLLDGSLSSKHNGSSLKSTGAMKIHFGSGNDSAEDYYYISIGSVTTAGLGLHDAILTKNISQRTTEKEIQLDLSKLPPWFADNIKVDFENNKFVYTIPYRLAGEKTVIVGGVPYYNPMNVPGMYGLDNYTLPVGLENVKITTDSDSSFYHKPKVNIFTKDGQQLTGISPDSSNANYSSFIGTGNDPGREWWNIPFDAAGNPSGWVVSHLKAAGILDANATYKDHGILRNQGESTQVGGATITMITDQTNKKGDEIIEISKVTEELVFLVGGHVTPVCNWYNIRIEGDLSEEFLEQYVIYSDPPHTPEPPDPPHTPETPDPVPVKSKVINIQTQELAQKALERLGQAIAKKDKIRANLGALQNRLENTASNLTIQAENLQVSESRISDVDVATEMTEFVRNQILTQSAVAMLGQANSMPQMLMQLIQ